MAEKLISSNTFCFNKTDNSGEGLYLTTKIYGNGDPDGIFLNQELRLQSYSNSASLHLVGTTLTPSLLRELANQIESAMIQAKESTNKQ
jgi:hypothetical protein